MTVVCQLSEQSLQQVIFDNAFNCWVPEDDQIRINLPLNRPGWYSLQGKLLVSSKHHTLYLMTDCSEPLMLPLTRKGVLLDMFYLPAEANKAWLQLEGADITITGCDVQLAPLGVVSRLWRMLRRVGLALFKQSAAQRRFADLHWYSPLFGVEQSYRKVSQLRAWAMPVSYLQWQRLNEQYSRSEIRRAASLLQQAPVLDIVIYGDAAIAQSHWQSSVDSIQAQATAGLLGQAQLFLLRPDTIPKFDLCIESSLTLQQLDGAALAQQLTTITQTKTTPRRVLLLRAGAQLAAHALCWWRLEAQQAPFSYSDHDYKLPERCQPQFKPDWAPELQRASHYIGDVLVCEASRLLSSGWLTHDWQDVAAGQHLMLRLTEQLNATEVPAHIPAVLWHDTLPARAPSAAALAAHVQRLQLAATVRQGLHQTLWLDYALTRTPLVSIIIPTRDMLRLLKPCVDSVLAKTDYPEFELIIVDNQSRCEETLAYMQQLTADLRVRVLPYDKPFNYSAINNYAVSQAKGEFICLLNNDTEVITANWLSQMVALALQDNVGAVGARLLYSDGRVQHAGDAVGPGGCADHMHSRIARDDAGYMQRAVVTQELSAVTAACLLTPKALFTQLDGLNATALAVAFNDVDYCLRVREAGYKVLYTPHAELYHHESVSRGKDDTEEKVRRTKAEANYMRQRWVAIMPHDPFYNPNLNYQRPDFSLGREPRVKAPWQR